MNEGIVRKGRVNAVNKDTREVRVYFPTDGLMSGWLKVLKNPPFIPAKDKEQRTEDTPGDVGDTSFVPHSHKLVIEPWFPEINAVVLCIYESGFNGDGYVLGEL